MAISKEQIRAGRALVGLSAGDLAEKTGLGLSTIQRMENRGTGSSTMANVEAVQAALEKEGVIFLPASQNIDGGAGVRLKGD